MGTDLRLPKSVSNSAVDKFVKSLDIGDVTQLQDVWYNELENHFIIQFSDDEAPETSQLTMSIGSLTTWNLGERVRSSDFQYLLHCVSLPEKT